MGYRSPKTCLIQSPMPPKSRAYNIAIIPPNDISRKAIRVSRSFKKTEVFFTLDGKRYFPHITLYMAEFPNKNISKVKKILDLISSNIRSFKVVSNRYRHENGWVHVNFKKNSSLMTLQNEIILKTNPLRAGLLMENDRGKFYAAPTSIKKNLKKYGFSNAFYKFTPPHITFSRLKRPDSKSIKKLKKYDFSFNVSKIGIFEKEEHGTCRKLVREFKLN